MFGSEEKSQADIFMDVLDRAEEGKGEVKKRDAEAAMPRVESEFSESPEFPYEIWAVESNREYMVARTINLEYAQSFLEEEGAYNAHGRRLEIRVA